MDVCTCLLDASHKHEVSHKQISSQSWNRNLSFEIKPQAVQYTATWLKGPSSNSSKSPARTCETLEKPTKLMSHIKPYTNHKHPMELQLMSHAKALYTNHKSHTTWNPTKPRNPAWW